MFQAELEKMHFKSNRIAAFVRDGMILTAVPIYYI